MTEHIRIGGLFRCCTATVSETMAERTARGGPKEGERLTCRYCKKETMVYRDGAWEWVGLDKEP